MKPPSLTIAEVNSLGRAEFVGRFGAIYEKSPWVAEGAWNARPFADATALETALADVVRHASHAQQLELLQMHPRLGTRLVLSAYSRSEQARSEERRVGKECRARWGPEHEKTEQ